MHLARHALAGAREAQGQLVRSMGALRDQSVELVLQVEDHHAVFILAQQVEEPLPERDGRRVGAQPASHLLRQIIVDVEPARRRLGIEGTLRHRSPSREGPR